LRRRVISPGLAGKGRLRPSPSFLLDGHFDEPQNTKGRAFGEGEGRATTGDVQGSQIQIPEK